MNYSKMTMLALIFALSSTNCSKGTSVEGDKLKQISDTISVSLDTPMCKRTNWDPTSMPYLKIVVPYTNILTDKSFPWGDTFGKIVSVKDTSNEGVNLAVGYNYNSEENTILKIDVGGLSKSKQYRVRLGSATLQNKVKMETKYYNWTDIKEGEYDSVSFYTFSNPTISTISAILDGSINGRNTVAVEMSEYLEYSDIVDYGFPELLIDGQKVDACNSTGGDCRTESEQKEAPNSTSKSPEMVAGFGFVFSNNYIVFNEIMIRFNKYIRSAPEGISLAESVKDSTFSTLSGDYVEYKFNKSSFTNGTEGGIYYCNKE